jgi:peptidoglycan/xylan/chitin deacetylase (PgdA/CDA1 family)
LRAAVSSFGRARRRAPAAATVGVPVSLAVFLVVIAALTLAGAGLGGTAAVSAGQSAGPGETAVASPSAGRSVAPDASHVVSVSTPSPSPLPSSIGPVDSQPPAQPGPPCLTGAEPGCVAAEPSPLPSQSANPAASAKLRVPIFEYHRVKPPAGEVGVARDLIVPADLFDQQMAAMAADGWHTITMGELGDDLRLGIQPAPKSFVVTFDDGYEDGYTYAFPILRKYGYVATYFIVASRTGTADHLDVSELKTLLAAGSEIGNHTMDHVDLQVQPPDTLRREVYGASAQIAKAIGVWPQSFCYPFGKTDETVQAAVAATPGLETATVEGGSKPEIWMNRLILPRIRVGPGSYPQVLVDKARRYLQ